LNDLTDFIVAQLNAKGIMVFGADSHQDNLKAYCFKGHDRKTPSLSIRRVDGAFLCFGCGIRGANWNTLAAHIGGQLLTEDTIPDRFLVMNTKLDKRIQKAMAQIDIPWDVEPWEKPWRRIPVSTLTKLNALRWWDDSNPYDRCERILFPVSMYDEIEGWVARRTDKAPPGKKLKTPYRNATHMSSADTLFPLDTVIGMNRKVLVLVEGPYDAIRLINYNIPALALLGTQNYHQDNRIHMMNAGAETIILAVDSDQGGDSVRLDIALSLREMFNVIHFECPPEEDPGSMPKRYLHKLWEIARAEQLRIVKTLK